MNETFITFTGTGLHYSHFDVRLKTLGSYSSTVALHILDILLTYPTVN
jgi:hypothetical protein